MGKVSLTNQGHLKFNCLKALIMKFELQDTKIESSSKIYGE